MRGDMLGPQGEGGRGERGTRARVFGDNYNDEDGTEFKYFIPVGETKEKGATRCQELVVDT